VHSVITSTSQLDDLFDEYYNAKYISVDTETDGLKINRKCIGISFATSLDNSFYIPILLFKDSSLVSPWKPEAEEDIKSFVIKLLTKSKRLILHNAVFDIKTIVNWLGINILEYVFCDTMLLAHTVHNEEGPMGLKPLAALLIDPSANQPQLEVKESVKANGGSTTKDKFEMWKCDPIILGRYGCWDTAYTIKLFEILSPRIKEQEVGWLWNNEVMPLLEVTYELNTNGLRIDREYFENLKVEVEQNIVHIENTICDELKLFIQQYEVDRVLEEVNITSRSALGKLLIEKFGSEDLILGNRFPEKVEFILQWYKDKYQVSRIFNFDSPTDKAYLLYQILGLPQIKTTKSGKPATDVATLETLCEQNDDNHIVTLLMERSKEKKILSTYIIPILENEIDGKIYTGFNQTGTISGRYSSSQPINLQTLPRDDKRIKKGFIANIGDVLVASDESALEPRCFAQVSGEQKLKDIFADKLDFYSKIAIDMFGMKDVSAREEDSNFLKKVNPHKRNIIKAAALSVPYGVGAGRLSKLIGASLEEAQDLIDLYLSTYPNLKQWMEDSERQAVVNGYVSTIMGRKRRTPLVHKLYTDYGIAVFSKRNIQNLFYKLDEIEGYNDSGELYYACRNALNNAKNSQIQGLAAHIINHAMIAFQKAKRNLGFKAKLILMVHDEIILSCPKDEAGWVSKILQDCMEHNVITKKLDVPMIAEPVISEKSLAEAK
jgi:DNA polymerase I-like protein with 3'-5' exonuclease and polymerase domains